MNRQERNKQKKKKARQERLRQEKHSRQAPPGGKDKAAPEAVGRGRPNDRPGSPAEARSTVRVATLVGTVEVPAGAAALEGLQPSSRGAAAPAEGESRADWPEEPLDNFFKGEPAQKWLDALLAGTDTMPIVNALHPAEFVPGELLLKASVCCEMLIAAELVAAGVGRPSRYLPPRVAAWLLERDVLFSPGVVALAATAVRRVGEFSELRHLWDTVHLGQEWLRGVEALHGRLQQSRPGPGGVPPLPQVAT
jgi:hypothetical protein